ncbi:MAG TPA: LemA family protein [Bryobacteraceae bacterium]|jgi:LemA protein|nr:LemA family protein [Bryobacteraceae bacterium]
MKVAAIIIGVLLLVGLIFGGQLISIRNDLVNQREAINSAWAQVDVQLQRRADLVPNLVNTVKGYAKQEQEVFGAIANARSALLNARTPQERMEANTRLDSALGRLLVVVENYPELKSNQNFLNLQFEVAGTENRIALERRRYNETVQKYNTTIELFPNNLAATLFGFQRNDAYFKTDPAARTAPAVNF